MNKALQNVLEDVISDTKIRQCLECRKCVSICPVAEITNNRFSPRKLVLQFLLGRNEEALSGEELWMCNLCFNCMRECPSDVNLPEFIAKMRALSLRFAASLKSP